MVLITDGFDTGKNILRWGTTLADALAQLSQATLVKADQISAKFLASRAFGLNVLSVTLIAPASDRPVMQAWYELVYDPACTSDNALLNCVSQVLGPPATQTNHKTPGREKSSFDVRYVAGWRFADFHAGLSIYGAPRETSEGLSLAAFYVNWEDEITAAAPYLAAMDEAERALERYAWNAEPVVEQFLEKDQHCYQVVQKASPDKALLRAQRCLRKPHLYQTPAMIADFMNTNQVVVWKNTSEQVWCISTKYETVCFPLGVHITISHLNVLPAKGSGGSYLTASDLELVSVPNSPAMTRLAALLTENGLAKVAFLEEEDY